MEVGMIGLGRMGANMAQRLVGGRHRVVGFDPNQEVRKSLKGKGVEPAASLDALVGKLQAPRALWLMVPAGEAVDKTLDALMPRLTVSDAVIDDGNSNYKDTLRRAGMLASMQIHYVDCGTSGGVWGLAEGYSNDDRRRRSGGRTSAADLRDAGARARPRRVGPSGSGHFTKMIHNGIEYGLMQAYAEGFSILQHKREFGLDLHQVAEIWRHGSVVRSWLLDLTAAAVEKNPAMTGIAPYVEDSGEGRWTVAEAIDLEVSAPVITLSLIERLRSRDADSYSDKLMAAMRNQFGGHAIKKE